MAKLKHTGTISMLLLVLSIAFSAVSCGPTPTASLSYTPLLLPVVFTIDTNGAISITLAAKLVTDIGEFSLSAGAVDQLQPEDMLLVLTHLQNGSSVDTGFALHNNQEEVTIVTNGTTTIRVRQKSFSIDTTKGIGDTYIAVTTSSNATSASTSPSIRTCKVTSANGLNIRTAPTSQSALVAHYPSGTVLNFVQIVNGENVNGNPRWGRSKQGNYFWLGGTDRPNG